MRSTILIVDDDEKIVSMLRRGWLLKDMRYRRLPMEPKASAN